MSNQPAPTKYQVRLTVLGRNYSPMSWHCQRDGRPTNANLKRFVESFEDSTREGGVNAHLGEERVASASVCYNSYPFACVASYESWSPIFTTIK